MSGALLWFGVMLAGVGLVAGLAAAARRKAVSSLFILGEVLGIALLALSAWMSQAAARSERLKRLNGEAEADSTHHFLRGQLQIATRLIVQKPLPHGAVATVTLHVPGVTVTKTDILTPADTLHAHLDTNGVHVSAMVVLKPLPVTWDWKLRQDSLSYRVTFQGCHDHAAQVQVEGPRWQAIQLADLQQDPNLCNPKPSWNPISLKPPSLVWTGAIITGTVLVLRLIR